MVQTLPLPLRLSLHGSLYVDDGFPVSIASNCGEPINTAQQSTGTYALQSSESSTGAVRRCPMGHAAEIICRNY
jgi:hypothetical protein